MHSDSKYSAERRFILTPLGCIVIQREVSRALEQDSLVRKHEVFYAANNLHTER